MHVFGFKRTIRACYYVQSGTFRSHLTYKSPSLYTHLEWDWHPLSLNIFVFDCHWYRRDNLACFVEFFPALLQLCLSFTASYHERDLISFTAVPHRCLSGDFLDIGVHSFVGQE